MTKFFKVTNLVKPHCTRCNKNYRIGENVTICNEYYGKGAERIQCNGPVVKDLHLDWSNNLLKDYSMLQHGDLSLFDEADKIIQAKLEAAKIGKSAETGKIKVNIQREIENFMRMKGVNIINKFDSEGNLVSMSVYVLPAGKARVSEYGYQELRDRFEQREIDPEKHISEGFLVFEEEGVEKAEPGKPIEISNMAGDDLTCKVCKRTFKSKLGLMGHMKTHKADEYGF